jgi:hypothetical protein
MWFHDGVLCLNLTLVTFEILTVVKKSALVLWIVTLCGVVGVNVSVEDIASIFRAFKLKEEQCEELTSINKKICVLRFC